MLGALEVERAAKRIGSSLEAAPIIHVTDANLFAAEFLMPRAEVRRLAGNIRDEQERVETLMETFLVSRTAARVRLKMLGFFGGEEPAMMLFDLAD